jgi:hypothetical protein
MNRHPSLSTNGGCSGDRNSSVREPSEGTDSSMPGSKTHTCLPPSCLSHHQVTCRLSMNFRAHTSGRALLRTDETLHKCVLYAVLSCIRWTKLDAKKLQP